MVQVNDVNLLQIGNLSANQWGYRQLISERSAVVLTHFKPIFPFISVLPLASSMQTLRFSDIFREDRNGRLQRNVVLCAIW